MSQDFKLNFNELYEGGSSSDNNAENYPAHGNTRNLGFAWPNGKKMFLNYAYLVTGAYAPEDNSIVLEFTTHAVTLKGIKLDALFDELIQHIPKWITCQDKRYNSIDDGEAPVVNEIVFVRL